MTGIASGEADDRQGLNLTGWTVLSVATLGAFLSALDSNIVALALPKIAVDFSSGVSYLGWVITGYILATVVFLLQAGRVGDRYGRKRIYLAGFALFGIASALCGVSQSISQLIAFRVIQGAGASMLQATTSPLVFESVPTRLRGTAMGVISTTWAVGAVTGPVLGGLLVAIDWRLIFYVNVPIAIAGVLIGAKVIPKRVARETQSGGSFNFLDSLLLGVTVAASFIWLTFFDLRFAALAVASMLGLIVAESRSSNPIINRELRRNRVFVLGAVTLGVSQLGYLGTPFALSFYFQSVHGFSSVIAGLFIAPLSVALVISNPTAGRLFDKLKRPTYLTLVGAIVEGLAMIGVGAAILAGSSPLVLSLLLATIGLAGGFIWTPMISGILASVRAERRGIANGTAITLVDVGYGASIALVIAVSAAFLPHAVVSQVYLGNFGALTAAQRGLFGQGIALAMTAMGIINFLVAILVLILLRAERRAS
jgi:EmrB/QacA subfamily drug resistance transporter